MKRDKNNFFGYLKPCVLVWLKLEKYIYFTHVLDSQLLMSIILYVILHYFSNNNNNNNINILIY
jgi:hypothetical protein